MVIGAISQCYPKAAHEKIEDAIIIIKGSKKSRKAMKKTILTTVFVTIALTYFLFFAGSQASAQEVVASYADGAGNTPIGSIIYRVADGSLVSRVQQVYRVGITLNLPAKIAVVDSSFCYVVFGNRYLARLRANDGTIVWVVDAGVTAGITTYWVTDIAVVGDNVFLSNQDPGGRIAKYRATDGALVWSVQRAVQVGVLRHLPLKLAAAGSDSFFALVGSKFLSKMRQSDGAVLWQKDI